MIGKKQVTVEVKKKPLRKEGAKKAIAVGKTTQLNEDIAKQLEKSGAVKIVTESK